MGMDLETVDAQLATRGDLADGIAGVKLAIAQLATKTVTVIAETRVDLIKWFLGSMSAMTGIMLAAFKLTAH